ncbi:MAG TPA: 2-C-methyl-D-erythritol 4-phosphate cytidylyltransferase [Ktedonobacterales bacterium]|nr:2-C-methyl-D-erythritol 4-phosphate cytidylyltransferase [Ktedonobacterales bacterium]
MASPTGQADAAAAILLALPSSGGEGGGDGLIWAPVAGRPVLAWSAAAFEAAPPVAESLLLVAPGRLAAAAALSSLAGWRRVRVLAVEAPADALGTALDALDTRTEFLVIHEAARPLVTPQLIADVLAAAQAEGMAVAVEPVKETIKRVEGETVAETLPRGALALLQTPLAIRRELLGALLAAPTSAPALGATHNLAAELAARALAAGVRVATVSAGHEQQLRVASAADQAVAEALLGRREEPA